MSLVITTTTSEGIVIGADSRQSYRNRKGMARIGSENAKKLFQINSRIAVGVTGLAFLEDEGVLRNISYYVDEFRKKEEIEELSVSEVANNLYSILETSYKPSDKLASLEKNIQKELTQKGCSEVNIKEQNYSLIYSFKDPSGKEQKGSASIENISYVVAGFNNDHSSYEVYNCYLPGEIKKKRGNDIKGNEYGADWLGQGDVVSRIILGFDPRLPNIQLFNSIISKVGPEEFKKAINNIQYVIQWGTMTLQDAIDFVDLMIKTTSAIQRFSDGIIAEPGDMPGVGGDVDIAIITEDEGFKWVSKKRIRHEDNILNDTSY